MSLQIITLKPLKGIESRDAIVQEVMDYTEDYINRITKTDTY